MWSVFSELHALQSPPVNAGIATWRSLMASREERFGTAVSGGAFGGRTARCTRHTQGLDDIPAGGRQLPGRAPPHNNSSSFHTRQAPPVVTLR
ncbi:Protein of unknown function [Gryllus bimaculatus]|nr:Protein of unknown function [Gryllus bimaculatus]